MTVIQTVVIVFLVLCVADFARGILDDDDA